MLRPIITVALTAISFGVVGATAYTASTKDNETAISQAYSDLDNQLSENKKTINSLYADMDEYKQELRMKDKTLVEATQQYQSNGESGLNFNLQSDYYNHSGGFGTGLKVDDILSQVKETGNYYQQNSGINRPVIMVSFSMPETTIKRLLEQARKVDGSLVFRGFKDDQLQVMMEKINELDVKKGSIIVDPTLFSRFDVNQVPTFVIPSEPIMPCTDSVCETPQHIKVTGDVSLDYVFELVERTGTQQDKDIVKRIKG